MGGVKSRCISNDRLTPLRTGMFSVVVHAQSSYLQHRPTIAGV